MKSVLNAVCEMMLQLEVWAVQKVLQDLINRKPVDAQINLFLLCFYSFDFAFFVSFYFPEDVMKIVLAKFSS